MPTKRRQTNLTTNCKILATSNSHFLFFPAILPSKSCALMQTSTLVYRYADFES